VGYQPFLRDGDEAIISLFRNGLAMKFTPNLKKFFDLLKTLDEDAFWDKTEAIIKEASDECDFDNLPDRWDDYLDKQDGYFHKGSESTFEFIDRIVDKKPQLKVLSNAIHDPDEDIGIPDYTVMDWIDSYSDDFDHFYIPDLFNRLRRNSKLKGKYDDYVSNAMDDCRESAEERRNPYGYRGLSRSMFYASRKVAASDRSALIRLASSLPVGSSERRAILAGLRGVRA